MRILFICKHNRFRSKVAEHLFKKYNKNKKIKALSCGVDPDYIPVAKSVVDILKKFNVHNINRNPHKLTGKIIDWSDLIIISANNVSKNKLSEFGNIKNKRVIKWIIYDTKQDNLKRILEISKQIDKKVKRLVKILRE